MFANSRRYFRYFQKRFFHFCRRQFQKNARNFGRYNQNDPHNSLRLLLRPTVGTLLFIPATFMAGEYMGKLRTQRASRMGSKYLMRRKECDYVLFSIMGINLLVFLMWNYRGSDYSKQSLIMERFFLNKMSSNRFSPLIGSVFSHMDSFHFLVNMFVLYNFGRPVFYTLGGTEMFIPFFLSCGCFSSLVSKYGHVLLRKSIHKQASLGASGAITGLFSLWAMLNPNSGVRFLFIPKDLRAKNVLLGAAAFDTFGALRGWASLDHFAHLGGYGFGVIYLQFLKAYVARKRRKLMKRRRK